MARKATFTTIKLPAAIKRELNKRFAADDDYVDMMCGVSDSLTRAVIGLKNEQDKAAA